MEILGLDPLYLANEGRFIAFVPFEQVERALRVLPAGAQLIGRVAEHTQPLVTLKGRLGATRIVEMFSGEQSPRIC